MRPAKVLFFTLFSIVLVSGADRCWAQPIPNQVTSVVRLQAVPDGNYLVTLELDGQVQRLNLQVQGNRAKCVDASDPKFKDVK